MADPRKPGPITIERCVAAWQRINQALQADAALAEDEQALVAMFAALDPSILSPDELLHRFIAAIAFAEMREAEARSFAATMEQRARRYAHRAMAMRTELTDVMLALERKSFTGSPFGTASLAQGVRSAVVLDEEKLPARFKQTTVKVLRRELTAALRAGEEIDGAVLGNPMPQLRLAFGRAQLAVDESHLAVDETVES